MTPAIAKAVVAKRPFNSITEFNAVLLANGLTAEQAMAIYERAQRILLDEARDARQEGRLPG